MKKFLIAFIALIAAVCCVLGLVACNNSIEIKGNTFIFESAEVTYADDVPQEAKDEVNVESIKAQFENKTVTFNSDGTVSGDFFDMSGEMTYTSDGKTYTVSVSGEVAATVKPDKDGIVLVAVNEGVTLTVKLKLVEQNNTEVKVTKNDYVGTYKFYSMTQSSTDPNFGTIHLTVGQEFSGVKLTEDFVVITLNADGTVKYVAQGDNVDDCSWTYSESGSTLRVYGMEAQLSYKNGKLEFIATEKQGEYTATIIETFDKVLENEKT